MAEINDLTTVDASNTARWPENMAPSAVNDAGRADEGLIARWHRDLNASVTTGGTSTAYTYAANQTLTAYYDGLMLGVDFNAQCGASPTINVDSLGAKSLVWPDGTALVAGDVQAGTKAIIVYDGTNFQVTTLGVGVGAAANQVDRNDQDWDALASATTVNIGAAASRNVNITGTTTITAFDTVAAGLERDVRFDGALTLTHNGTSLILPGGANITTAAGDVARFISEGSGNWRCKRYMKASGAAIVGGINAQTFTANGTWTKPSGATKVLVEAWGGGGGGAIGSATRAGGGGGGGSYRSAWFSAADLGATETVTIGAGGAARSTQGDGNAGSNTTFGSWLTAYGGGGGGDGGSEGGGGGGGGSYGAGTSSTDGGGGAGGNFDGGAGGAASGTNAGASPTDRTGGGGGGGGFNAGTGGAGAAAYDGGGGGGGSGVSTGGAGGAAEFSGGGGGGGGTSTGGAGGTSTVGGNGGAGSSGAADATAGTQPGGGGGGGYNGQNSGAGADGQVIVTSW